MTGGARYRAFLVERDGVPDMARRTLSRREALFYRLARDPVRSRARVDREAFVRNLSRRRPEAGLGERMLFLLATAKANQAERFGVGLAEAYGRVHALSDPVRVHIALQEVYHTRILGDVCAIFDLPVPPVPPPLVARLIVRTLVATPERWHLPLTGACEMAGCILFAMLGERGTTLFADEPAVARRIRALFDEILGDELGHVGYIASELGPRKRALMRGLYRLLGPRLAAAMPEVVQLLGRRDITRRFAAPFPLGAMVAALPGRAFAAALV